MFSGVAIAVGGKDEHEVQTFSEILVQMGNWSLVRLSGCPFMFYEPQVWDDEYVQIYGRYYRIDQILWIVVT